MTLVVGVCQTTTVCKTGNAIQYKKQREARTDERRQRMSEIKYEIEKKLAFGIVCYRMTIDEAITLMRNEKTCVLKADTCDRDCAKCELFRKTEDLLLAYNLAIRALERTKWIPCSVRMPEEHEWIGTKEFGTTISDEVYVTFGNPEGKRFAKHVSFQNGKLSSFDQNKIDAFYKGSVPIAWMPLPKPYNAETEGKNEYIHKANDTN